MRRKLRASIIGPVLIYYWESLDECLHLTLPTLLKSDGITLLNSRVVEMVFLFVMVAVVTTWILHSMVDQNEHAEQVKQIADLPCEKPKVVMLDRVAPILSKTPHLDTSTSLPGTSRSLADEVVNNANAAVRDQSNVDAAVRDQSIVDMSDTPWLQHQDPTPATSSFDIENPSTNLLPEGSYGMPPPVPDPEGPDPKFVLKVAILVITISATGIVGVISGVIGNEKALLPRELLFKGFISLNYIALVSSIGLFILIKLIPNIPGCMRIVKFFMWISIASLVYSLGMATCIIFPTTAEIILILVAPLVLVGLVVILSFAYRE